MGLRKRIHKDSLDFGRGILKDLESFGTGFAGFHETLGEDSQVFARLWKRICKDLLAFKRGFTRIC